MPATSPTFALHVSHMPSLASLFSPTSTTDTRSLQYLHTELQADHKKRTCSCTDFCMYKSLSIITILTLLIILLHRTHSKHH